MVGDLNARRGSQIIHQGANESLRLSVPEDCPWKDLKVQLPLARPDSDQIVEELSRTLLESGCAGDKPLNTE